MLSWLSQLHAERRSLVALQRELDDYEARRAALAQAHSAFVEQSQMVKQQLVRSVSQLLHMRHDHNERIQVTLTLPISLKPHSLVLVFPACSISVHFSGIRKRWRVPRRRVVCVMNSVISWQPRALMSRQLGHNLNRLVSFEELHVQVSPSYPTCILFAVGFVSVNRPLAKVALC